MRQIEVGLERVGDQVAGAIEWGSVILSQCRGQGDIGGRSRQEREQG